MLSRSKFADQETRRLAGWELCLNGPLAINKICLLRILAMMKRLLILVGTSFIILSGALFLLPEQVGSQSIQVTDDDDGDGINNIWEGRLQTSPGKRTLFIKPLYQTTSTSTASYWSDFKKYFHQTIESYLNAIFEARARKPDGTAPVGLEIRVIGDDANPYEPMRAKTSNVPTYDPAKDYTYADGRPPVHIITITAKGSSTCTPLDYEVSGASNKGHTRLKSIQQPDPANPEAYPTVSKRYYAWTWDTKGYTYNLGTAYNWGDPLKAPRAGYHGATTSKPVEVGLHALACYMVEGVYDSLTAGKKACATNCAGAAATCCNTEKWSTSNRDHVFAPAATVEFNEYSLDSAATITAVGRFAVSGSEYNRDQVLVHTLIHEIVHALLKASTTLDECQNPCCPMSNFVARERGWTLTELGASSCGAISKFSGRTCTHSSGLNDITQKGVVWNVSH
jgi:hypothetical protein